jgi:hypothetical protein
VGLDSFLYAKKYLGNYNHSSDEEKETYNQIVTALGLTDFATVRRNRLYVRVEVAYWRKANHIHKFFVDLSEEEDNNCEDIDVGRDDLVELLSRCKRLLESRDTPVETNTVNPAEILPTEGGFFFGSTDYGEYYYSDIEHTVEVLEEVLNHPAIPEGDYSWSFVYRASW